MPQYQYKDANSHIAWVTHPMLYSTAIVCTTCGEEMWRIPQPVAVTWGGLAPSDGELSPGVRSHLNNVDRLRDDFAAEHEAHERRTANE